MGLKKGRAARTAAAGDCPTEASLNLCHDGTCVMYTAANGSEYRIDVATMQQLDVKTGACRAVYRKDGCGKRPHWEFEAVTEGARNYTPPKYVTFALEERWQVHQAHQRDSSGEVAACAHWVHAISMLDNDALLRLVDLLEVSERIAIDTQNVEHDGKLVELAEVAASDKAVQHTLAERVLGATWPIQQVVCALRCLLRLGLRPTPAHCRLAAIGRGSMSIMRVLLVEADINVCGLVLFESGGAALSKKSHTEGSWVQQSKESLKALMARGALLGHHAPRSKLLRKLEEDGNALWTERALDCFTRVHPELPEGMRDRIRAFF